MSVVSWDIESADADKLFTYGDSFIRVWGAAVDNQAVQLGTSAPELASILNNADWITGSNIFGFDLLALCYYFPELANWEQLTAKAIDTTLLARLDYPPMARDTGGSEDKYDLNHIAARLGVEGKTDDIRSLARKFGGYDQIPVDDPDYLSYLTGDVHASRQVFEKLHHAWTDYAKREHRVASIFGRMSLNGFRVDVSLLEQRISEGEEHKLEALHILSEDYDLPLGRFSWKGRGKDKEEYWEEFASPLTALEGREWLIDMYEAYGINNPPVTDKGRLSIRAEELRPLAENQANHPDLRRALGLMAVVTQTRTVYQTVADYLTKDGRVHPLITMSQASGRSSVTKPGLTVMGKRGGRWRERMVFTPEPGHVLVSFDMSQLDARAVAALSQDPAYIEMCQPGKDLHTEIAVQVFGSADYRTKAKPLTHGYNYGIGMNKLISAGHDPELVKTFFLQMRKRFPRVTEWQEAAREEGEAGHLLENGWGRKMRCDPARAYTQAPALLGQGAAGDIMKEALLRMPEEFRSCYRNYVHDEVVFDFPEKDAEEMSREAMKAMTFEWRGVPIFGDQSKPGTNWGEISAK